MNLKNMKTSDPHTFVLNLSNKINLKRSDEYVALSKLTIYYTLKKIKKPYQIDKFKISAPAWNDKFELPDGSISVSVIQDYFEYSSKHEALTDHPPLKIYINKNENRITLKFRKKITKGKDGENEPHLEFNY